MIKEENEQVNVQENKKEELKPIRKGLKYTVEFGIVKVETEKV